MHHLSLLVITLCFAYIYGAGNFVSNALGSNMVLQRAPLKANVWGWSKTAGSVVSVVLGGKTYQATADSTGFWIVSLDATPAGGPYQITITSSAGESSTLSNILFGDVFVCSGQSNMQMTVSSVFNAAEEIKAADGYPNIRVFTVGQGTASATPLQEFATIERGWAPASAASIGLGNWSAFSAACWFFGKNLYDQLKVPIGLFSDNWGGTIVQAWSSPDALKKCPQLDVPVGADPNDPSALWNAMIIPILRMTIKGATWYQGESNAGNPNNYACSFPAMISDWRAKWLSSGNFGFFYVQLAPWAAGSNDAEGLTRLSQLYANALPDVGFATAADLGDPTSPFGDIHPRGKQPVGYRLSLAARAISYGQAIQYLGPIAASWGIVSAGVVDVSFTSASVGGGLAVVAFSCDSHVPPAQCAEYEIGTSSGWIRAKGVILNTTAVRITADVGSAQTIGVRYGYANYPIMSLRNVAGLPAIPFYFPNPIKPTFKDDVVENYY